MDKQKYKTGPDSELRSNQGYIFQNKKEITSTTRNRDIIKRWRGESNIL